MIAQTAPAMTTTSMKPTAKGPKFSKRYSPSLMRRQRMAAAQTAKMPPPPP